MTKFIFPFFFSVQFFKRLFKVTSISVMCICMYKNSWLFVFARNNIQKPVIARSNGNGWSLQLQSTLLFISNVDALWIINVFTGMITLNIILHHFHCYQYHNHIAIFKSTSNSSKMAPVLKMRSVSIFTEQNQTRRRILTSWLYATPMSYAILFAGWSQCTL